MAVTSEPACGSEIAIAVTIPPAAISGRYFCRCSSEPKCSSGMMNIELRPAIEAQAGETFEISDVTLPDVGDERIFVGPDVEGLDDNAGAFELKRYMSGAGGGFTHPALDRHGAE